MGVIHFDLKPDNILIDETGRLKISDFGMATRWPRISAEHILAGSGLGGDVGNATGISRLSDREGDRVYMAPEMLRGDFTAANDVFRYAHSICGLDCSNMLICSLIRQLWTGYPRSGHQYLRARWRL